MNSKPRTRFLLGARTAMLAVMLTALGAAATAVAPPDDEAPAVAKLGQKAPDFALADTNGQMRRLADYRDRIVVLEWVDPDCPVVGRHYRARSMQETYRQAKALDQSIVWLAINSTQRATAQKNRFWIKQFRLEYPILADPAGEVGRRFDARLTPHMFVIDAKGILRYHGAIDDNRLGNKRAAEVTNHVLGALKKIVADDVVSPEHVKPYGCAIKYRR